MILIPEQQASRNNPFFPYLCRPFNESEKELIAYGIGVLVWYYYTHPAKPGSIGFSFIIL